MKRILLVLLTSSSLFTACSLEDILNQGGSGGGLTDGEIIDGLKEALKIGTENAASDLNQVDGYLGNALVRILLPDEVNQALNYADAIDSEIQNNIVFSLSFDAAALLVGFSLDNFRNMRGQLLTSLNRAAEAAAPLSVGIFKDAILAMTIQDGLQVLRGDSTAATDYFHGKTISPLTSAFRPFVDSTLALVNAVQLWEDYSAYHNAFVNLYNQNTSLLSGVVDMSSLNTVSTDLGGYTTEKALDGLFYMVGEEESKIRNDPVARVTEILVKVFGSLD